MERAEIDASASFDSAKRKNTRPNRNGFALGEIAAAITFDSVAQAVERQLISLNPELSASKSILGQPIPTRDPIDVVCPWQIASDALARRVGKISAGASGRELWWTRIGWDGNAPMTIAQMSQSQGKPISVIAGMLGRAIR